MRVKISAKKVKKEKKKNSCEGGRKYVGKNEKNKGGKKKINCSE